jgi:hypothetical protein
MVMLLTAICHALETELVNVAALGQTLCLNSLKLLPKSLIILTQNILVATRILLIEILSL